MSLEKQAVAPPGPHVIAARVSPGQPVTLFGHLYFRGCHDTSSNGRTPAPAPPLHAVHLVLVDSTHHTHPLATARPGRRGSFVLRVSLPRTLPPGRTLVRDDAGGVLRLRMRHRPWVSC